MEDDKIDDGLTVKSSDFLQIEDADTDQVLERRSGQIIRDMNEHE
jgi:hypothetical protein